jgi:hypothetical protein
VGIALLDGREDARDFAHGGDSRNGEIHPPGID